MNHGSLKPCCDCGSPVYQSSTRCRACASEHRRGQFRPSVAGKNHPNWHGGTYKYRGERWQQQRLLALSRDGHACVKCGETKGLRVHHIKGASQTGDIWDNSLDNLVTLCNPCHAVAHGLGGTRPYPVICLMCGKEFVAGAANAYLCSRDCALRRRRQIQRDGLARRKPLFSQEKKDA